MRVKESDGQEPGFTICKDETTNEEMQDDAPDEKEDSADSN